MDLGLKDKVVLKRHQQPDHGRGNCNRDGKRRCKGYDLYRRTVPKISFWKHRLRLRKRNRKPSGDLLLCDVNKAEDIEALVKHTVETLGDIYALVNMCPGPKPGPFVSFDDAAWEGRFCDVPALLRKNHPCGTPVHETSRRRPYRKLNFFFR
ncbi:MAG: hypothetical protein ACLT76_10710 [Clostridium fessum]